MGYKLNIVFTIIILGMSLIAFKITLENSSQTDNPTIWLIYVTGAVFLSGLSAIYPLGTKAKDEWGDKVPAGKITNLSPFQSALLFVWIVGGGVVAMIYGGFTNGS